MPFPEEFIKGVPNKNFLDEEGNPGMQLFYIELKQGAAIRDDGFIESSINWRDDDNAIKHILQQEKEPGKLQFQEGAALLSRLELDRIKLKDQRLTYERRPIEGNCYHGNILLAENVPKSVMRKIAAAIALQCFIGLSKMIDH